MRFRLILPFLMLAAPALAQEPPACTPAREGMVACMGEKLCTCAFDRGGSIAGRPAGHRWDCGVLRPSCGVAPADLGRQQQFLPPGLLVPVPQTAIPGLPPGSMGQSGWGAGPRGTR
jgi:hypothetical protein